VEEVEQIVNGAVEVILGIRKSFGEHSVQGACEGDGVRAGVEGVEVAVPLRSCQCVRECRPSRCVLNRLGIGSRQSRDGHVVPSGCRISFNLRAPA
jgi:hypothetical protein